MPEKEPNVEILARQGTHQGRRLYAGDWLLNMGPTQPFRNVLSNELLDQSYTYANPTGTPFDMYLNIIPGMHPFHWDLFSTVIALGAGGLGAGAGVMDKSKANDYVHRRYDDIIKEGGELATFAQLVGAKWKTPEEDGEGGGGPRTASGARVRGHSGYFQRMLNASGEGIMIKALGKDGKVSYREKYHNLIV
jgi:hypothetical protein